MIARIVNVSNVYEAILLYAVQFGYVDRIERCCLVGTRILIGHEPDNLRVSSGWAKDCCNFLIPTYVHIIY